MKKEVFEILPGKETADEWFERLCTSDEERAILVQDDGLFRRHLVVRLLGDYRPVGKCLHCPHPFHEGSCSTSTVSNNRPSIPCDCKGHGSPIDMILHCPACGTQHVDAPEPDICITCGHTEREHEHEEDGVVAHGGWCRMHMKERCEADCKSFETWTNPPHKSHLCHGCGIVWRPADVPTNGVVEIKTRGEKDSWPEVAA